MDVLLTKAEPIRNSGNPSVITHLKKKRKCYCTDVIAARKGWGENTWEEQPYRLFSSPRSVEEREEMLQAPGLRFPCSPWCRPRWGTCAPVAHGGPRGCRDPLTVEETQAGVGAYLRGGFEPMGGLGPGRDLQNRGRGAHTEAGFLVGFVTLWGTNVFTGYAWRTAPHGRVTHLEAVSGEPSPLGWI